MNSPEQTIRLLKITDADMQFLYDLLKKRDPRANISHKKMPTFEEHRKFVISKPYTAWYVIMVNENRAGSIYLSKNDEIGIFLIKDFFGKNVGAEAMKQLMKLHVRKRYLANVAPENIVSQKFFQKNKFTGLQYTYELIVSNED